MSRYDYKIHPLAALFPELPPDEFKKLKNDIQAHGQREPIMLSQDGTTLLDGRHRLRVCIELGRAPNVERFPDNGVIRQLTDVGLVDYRCTEADYIWSKNVFRRHLSDDQRAAIAVKWSDAEKEASKQRQTAALKRGDQLPVRVNPPTREPTATNDRHATRNALAQKARTTPNKIRQAQAVAKHKPELLLKIESGAMMLKDAAKQAETNGQCHPIAPGFDEQAVLARLYKEWEASVVEGWPKNLDLTPVIRKVYRFATFLEGLQRLRSAELQKKVQAVGVGVGAQ
jgi:hypothetical protein